MNKQIIGENADILWRLMNQESHRQWQLEELKQATGFDDMQLASAIGWLAREDKIQIELRNPKDDNKKAYVYLMLNAFY